MLEAAFDSALGGRAQAVLVDGEAGIGKSRLVEEFCDRARLRDATVAVGSTVPYGDALPYVPIAGILRSLAGNPLAEQLLLVATGEGDTDLDEAPDLIDAAMQRRTYHAQAAFASAMLRLVAALANDAPMVLVIEDVHWSDLASASLVDYLLRNLGDSRVLIICSVRSEEVTPDHRLFGWLTELKRFARTTPLLLEGLDRVQLRGLLQGTPSWPLTPDQVESIVDRAQGNPFYAEELSAVGSDSELPVSVQDLLLARVRQRSSDCRRLLAAAAVAGLEVQDDVLSAVMGLDTTDAVTESIDHRILVLVDGGAAYQFRHALLREAIYASLTSAERKRWHRMFADALSIGTVSSSQRVAEIAGHRWAAAEWRDAIEPSIEAAEAAVRSFAFREAEVHFAHALDAAALVGPEHGSTRMTHVQILEKAAETSYFAANHERAVELSQAAVAEALEAGDSLAAARSYVLLARALWGVGTSAGAQDALRNARSCLPSEPTVELAYVIAEDARFEMLMSHDKHAVELAREAIAIAQDLGARSAEGNAKNTLGCSLGNLGRSEEGLALLRESLEIAEDLQLPEDLNRAYTNLSYVLAEAGRFEETASIALDALVMGEELGGIRLNGAVTNSISALEYLGRWDEAEVLAAGLGNASYGYCASAPYRMQIPFATRRGRLAEAEGLLQMAHDVSDGLEDVQTTAVVSDLHAECALAQGHPEMAITHARHALELAARGDHARWIVEFASTALRVLADLSASGPDRESGNLEATRIIDTVRTLAAPTDSASKSGRQVAFERLCEAEYSRYDRSSPDLWREAKAGFDASPDAYRRAYCAWREAEALVESGGSRLVARECLRDALARSRALRTAPLTTNIQALAQRARLELPEEASNAAAPNPAKDLGLTSREVEILGHLAIGATDREIAEDLFISKKTVSVHVSNVLRKLEVANRVEAGRIGQLHGVTRSSA